MTQRELKQRIMDDPDLTRDEKVKQLNALRVPYVKMSDEELLQLVRDFTREHGREPAQADVLYDRELKARFHQIQFFVFSNDLFQICRKLFIDFSSEPVVCVRSRHIGISLLFFSCRIRHPA